MSKLIGVLIIAALLLGGYFLFNYYKSVEENQKNPVSSESAPAVEVDPFSLAGVPPQLQDSLRSAETGGARALKEWLDRWGNKIQDPRKAWIQLDYVVLLAKDDPNAARKLFAEVKNRTPASSPVYPRIQKLAPTYER